MAVTRRRVGVGVYTMQQAPPHSSSPPLHLGGIIQYLPDRVPTPRVQISYPIGLAVDNARLSKADTRQPNPHLIFYSGQTGRLHRWQGLGGPPSSGRGSGEPLVVEGARGAGGGRRECQCLMNDVGGIAVTVVPSCVGTEREQATMSAPNAVWHLWRGSTLQCTGVT